ncbi:hypothetical protein [Pseudodesulfovibrio indicus]|uniref:Uncharacterized protein n=1 Tax=Pseudodesulfovibrio indicus TaxID=1716143 RepID=A0AA94PQT4_9BACT|nr:hypothetical protein [Pseudodesulfovibrio indicus]TDT91760.1 hypothetical protein EDC59_101159 [Pseudodesulfovibrio indicus]
MVKVESEKELENFLARTLAGIPNMLVERQVRLGPYGRADILAWTVLDLDGVKTLLGHVIEVKKEDAGLKAIFQLSRYVKGVEVSFIDLKNKNPSVVDDVFVLGSLFCNNVIDTEEVGYLLAQMQNMYIYKYLISMKVGIKAKRWPGWINGIIDHPKGCAIIDINDLLAAEEKSADNINFTAKYYNPFWDICI